MNGRSHQKQQAVSHELYVDWILIGSYLNLDWLDIDGILIGS